MPTSAHTLRILPALLSLDGASSYSDRRTGASPSAPLPPASHTPWTTVGPSNIGDSITPDGGEAGTVQPVVAAAANPDVIYTGGNNNAASSGVLKSTDFGRHWVKVNRGLADTRIHGLYIVDQHGEHVVAGTPSGVYETLDSGGSWTHIAQTRGWGVANSFRNGSIGGAPHLFVGTNAGLGNVPLVETPLAREAWRLIRSPAGSSAWRTNRVSISDYRAGQLLSSSVVGGCLWVGGRGVLHVATVLNATEAAWEVQPDQPCQSMAMDPNDADHLLVNNASNRALYESTDGGRTFHPCLGYRGAVMVAIDRTGWYYVGSEAGIYRNAGGCRAGKWEAMFDTRIARRTGAVRDRVAHDFQAINIDFGGDPGGVAFGSDQGVFMKNVSDADMRTNLRLISGNGDMSNNIIMHPSIAMGEEPHTRYLVTALWDWGPVASWDNGTHWPSWQTPDDGSALGFFGEGGGCFGVGRSVYSLCIHHHNVARSSRGGKNFSRFVVPNGASVGAPAFARRAGSRAEPSGLLYAPMTMEAPAWEAIVDTEVVCGAGEAIELGAHTRDGCLARVDIGLQHGWHAGAAAVWRGATDGSCTLCAVGSLRHREGAVSFVRRARPALTPIGHDGAGGGDGEGGGGVGEDEDDWSHKLWRQGQLEYNATCSEWNSVGPKLAFAGRSQLEITSMALDVTGTGTGRSAREWYVLKSPNFGANWSWVRLPPFLQGVGGLVADPTSDTIYVISGGSCISHSADHAESWSPCWKAPGLTGRFRQLVVRDSRTMIVLRDGDVPLRTNDGGASWRRMESLASVARRQLTAEYSWSGKTLALSGVAGQLFVWVSRDDGDTWTNESGDYSAMSGGVAQWYESTLYISSLGQGIASKTFEEE